jgi:hypothetical protein
MTGPAYELKFLLTEPQAKEVQQRVGDRLAPDPHADRARGNTYETTTLYCDTAQFEVYRGVGLFNRRKHRVRRYGQAAWVFLERKTRWGDRVKKRRSLVPDTDLSLLASTLPSVLTPEGSDEQRWPGDWFHRHLQRRVLLPVCNIAYERVALIGESVEGPLRLTFDRRIRGVLTRDWSVTPLGDGLPLLTGQVICEFKYQRYMPALFKEIIQAMHLSPSPCSKYRTFLRVSGHAEGRPHA